MPNHLTIKGLSTKAGGPFNFTVSDQIITFVKGPSGSGKSLLLRAIADLDEHRGEVYLNGITASSIPAKQWRKSVSLLLNESAWWLPQVKDHFLLESSHSKETILNWAKEILLPPGSFKRPISELSTGELSRWALLRLLSRDPQALLLDEPTANLDEQTTLVVEKFLMEQIKARSLITLWVSHNSKQISRLNGIILDIQESKKNNEVSND